MANWNREGVIKNCENIARWQGVDWNINAKDLFALLEGATTSRNRDLKDQAKVLLEQMTQNKWSIPAGGHAGGLGGNGRGADPNPHITLRAGRKTYHLGYTIKDKKIILERITS